MKLIVLEGMEASGKGTIATGLVAELKKHGYKVLHTREPGGTPMAEYIRNILLSNEAGEELSPEGETLLALAAHAYHQKSFIDAGWDFVVCERWSASTVIYQARPDHFKTDVSRIQVMSMACGIHFKPDLYVLVERDEETRMRALRTRKGQHDHLEDRSLKNDEWQKSLFADFEKHFGRTIRHQNDSRSIETQCAVLASKIEEMNDLTGIGHAAV